MTELDRTALIVVDVQRAFDDADYWGRRNNPACEANVAARLAAWREAERPDGTVMSADELARATARSLHGECATAP
jgi:nicotinamidase-related amidase